MTGGGGVPNPFEGLFGDLARLLGSQLDPGSRVHWEMAAQFAQWVATAGETERNVDPLERIKLEELLRVAEMHVRDATGLEPSPSGRALTVAAVNRGEWARRTLVAFRPLLEAVAGSLTPAAGPDEDGAPDPATQLLGSLPQLLGPVMLGFLAGSMTGHLAQRAFGEYDLPIPRPASDEVVLVPANLASFVDEWSVPTDDLRMWVCVHELAHHAVLSLPHVRARLDDLLLRHAGAFQPGDGGGLEDKLGEVDPSDPSSFERILGDPEVLLGAVQSDEQRRLLPQLQAITCTIEGYVDHVLDRLGGRLIGSYGMLSEALRRRRVEATAGDRYVGRLFGLELSQVAYDRGAAFVEGVVERAGEDALARLWRSERELPTPAEVDAPGLWLARIDLPDDTT